MTVPTTAGDRAAARTSEAPALSVRDLEVRFGAFRALTGISLDVWPGEVVGVIGPNGAGKSTLVNALAGVVSPAAGAVELQGRALIRARPVRRSHLGLVRTFQTAQLFGSLTVKQNIDLARRKGGSTDGLVEVALEQLGLNAVSHLTTDELSGGQRKLVELVRALAMQPHVLLLDEPVAGVPIKDRTRVLDLLRPLVDDAKSSVLLIEHDMEFVSSCCDWIYVMNAGEMIASGTWEQISKDRAVLEAYLGTSTAGATTVDATKKRMDG